MNNIYRLTIIALTSNLWLRSNSFSDMISAEDVIINCSETPDGMAEALPVHSHDDVEQPDDPLALPLEVITFEETVKRYYITPYVLQIESENRILLDQPGKLSSRDRKKLEKNHRISSEVSSMVAEVVEYLSRDSAPLFRGGELSRCGSVEEGTKVGACDEFDYQYLVAPDNIKATRKPPLRTKPRSSSDDTKSFFSLAMQEQADNVITEHELQAKDVHSLFKDEVEKALSMQVLPHRYMLKKAGPAVKIVLFERDKEGRPKCLVKIDLTLGIRADPSKVYKVEELTPLARYLPWGLSFKCHFVCAHDYWKVAFVETEQELMKKITEHDPYKMACYRSIKCIRDMVDIKDPYGDGILPSYPIKMTFLDIALKDCENGINWKMEDMADHVIHILKEVEERGQDHRLTSPFLHGEDIMAESDRSYLESRRILNKLKEAEELFLRKQSSIPLSLTIISVFLFPYYGSNILWPLLPLQFLICIFGLLMRENPKHVHPFYFIYNDVSRILMAFAISNGIACTLVTISFISNFPFTHPLIEVSDPLALSMWQIAICLACLPATVAAVSISLNAICSLQYNKNLQLFNSVQLFPYLAWVWQAPDGRRLQYLPEITGRKGLTPFARLRAVVVLVLTIIAVILYVSILFTIIWVPVKHFFIFPGNDNNAYVFFILYGSITEAALLLIIMLLLFEQFITSRSWRRYCQQTCRIQASSLATSRFCYTCMCCKKIENI